MTYTTYIRTVDMIAGRLVAAINSLPEKTAHTMAEASYIALQAFAKELGMQEGEVVLRRPGEPRHFADQTCYCVAFEAGPYQWAHVASMAITVRCGKLCEPYYSFDICFDPAED